MVTAKSILVTFFIFIASMFITVFVEIGLAYADIEFPRPMYTIILVTVFILLTAAHERDKKNAKTS